VDDDTDGSAVGKVRRCRKSKGAPRRLASGVAGVPVGTRLTTNPLHLVPVCPELCSFCGETIFNNFISISQLFRLSNTVLKFLLCKILLIFAQHGVV
jgi:hypothetical protein